MPSSPGAAEDLLEKSIREGATVVAIGALTNLALLERKRPGTLKDVPVVAMGGWIEPPAEGLPQWGPERDFNVQCDTEAAQIVAAAADLTLVTLPVTLKAPLREMHLPRLRSSGPLGELLARQSEAIWPPHSAISRERPTAQYITTVGGPYEPIHRREHLEVAGDLVHNGLRHCQCPSRSERLRRSQAWGLPSGFFQYLTDL
jgi:hypothetical protein